VYRDALAAAMLAASLVGPPSLAAEAPQITAGLRLGWLSTTGDTREILTGGVLEPEGYIEAARPGSPLSLEASLSGYSVPGEQSGSAVFTVTGVGTYPTNWAYAQTLTVIPMLLTLKLGPRGEHFSAHVGAGVGGVYTYLRQTLGFSNPNVDAALRQTSGSGYLGPEAHAQVGADWRLGEHFGAGLLARWSYAYSGLGLNQGFQGVNASGAEFAANRSAGNVSGLFLGASGWWRF
jgi:hypothetical protein